jgi:hypothetical protein
MHWVHPEDSAEAELLAAIILKDSPILDSTFSAEPNRVEYSVNKPVTSLCAALTLRS